jgi:hypothetical protein
VAGPVWPAEPRSPPWTRILDDDDDSAQDCRRAHPLPETLRSTAGTTKTTNFYALPQERGIAMNVNAQMMRQQPQMAMASSNFMPNGSPGGPSQTMTMVNSGPGTPVIAGGRPPSYGMASGPGRGNPMMVRNGQGVPSMPGQLPGQYPAMAQAGMHIGRPPGQPMPLPVPGGMLSQPRTQPRGPSGSMRGSPSGMDALMPNIPRAPPQNPNMSHPMQPMGSLPQPPNMPHPPGSFPPNPMMNPSQQLSHPSSSPHPHPSMNQPHSPGMPLPAGSPMGRHSAEGFMDSFPGPSNPRITSNNGPFSFPQSSVPSGPGGSMNPMAPGDPRFATVATPVQSFAGDIQNEGYPFAASSPPTRPPSHPTHPPSRTPQVPSQPPPPRTGTPGAYPPERKTPSVVHQQPGTPRSASQPSHPHPHPHSNVGMLPPPNRVPSAVGNVPPHQPPTPSQLGGGIRPPTREAASSPLSASSPASQPQSGLMEGLPPQNVNGIMSSKGIDTNPAYVSLSSVPPNRAQCTLFFSYSPHGFRGEAIQRLLAFNSFLFNTPELHAKKRTADWWKALLEDFFMTPPGRSQFKLTLWQETRTETKPFGADFTLTQNTHS